MTENFIDLHTVRGRQRKKELHLYTQSNNDQDSTTLHAISAFLSDIAKTSNDGLLAFFLKVAMTEKLQVAVQCESNSLHFLY